MGEGLADQKGEHGAQYLRSHDSYKEVNDVDSEEAKDRYYMIHFYLSFVSFFGRRNISLFGR